MIDVSNIYAKSASEREKEIIEQAFIASIWFASYLRITQKSALRGAFFYMQHEDVSLSFEWFGFLLAAGLAVRIQALKAEVLVH